MRVAFISLNRNDHTNLLSPLFLTTFANSIEHINKGVTFFNRNYSVDDPNLFEKVHRYISGVHPDLLCVPMYVWNHKIAIDLIKEEKRKNKDLKVVVGGPQAFLRGNLIIQNPGIDFLIAGEGEYPFSQLLIQLLKSPERPELHVISNLIWTDGNGIHSAPTSAECLFSYEIINNIFTNLQLCQFDLPGKTYMIETARGCPFNCSYCCCNKGKRGIRYRSLDIVLEEIYKLHIEAGGLMRSLYIVDPSFFVNKKRDMEIVSLLKSLQIPFMIELHLETVTEEDITFLYDCGMYIPSIGLQSFSADILRNVNREPVSKKMLQNLDALVKLRQNKGVAYMIGIILGLPGDNYELYKTTLDKLWKYKPPMIDFFHLAVLPETKLKDQTDEFGIEYDSEPPYLVTRTHSWSYADMEKAKTLILTIKSLTKCLGDRILFIITDLLSMNISQLAESFQAEVIKPGRIDINSEVKEFTRSFLVWVKNHILSHDINRKTRDIACQLVEDFFSSINHSWRGKPPASPETGITPNGEKTKLILNREIGIQALTYDANKILSALGMLPITDPNFIEFISQYELEEKQYAVDAGLSVVIINEGTYEILRQFEDAMTVLEVVNRLEDYNISDVMEFVSGAFNVGILKKYDTNRLAAV